MSKTQLLAAIAGLALTSIPARSETVWNMPTPYPDTTFHTINIRQFADDVAAATNGELTIVVHSAGSLFSHPEIRDAVITRQAEIGELLISLLTNENAVFGVDSVPFLATNYVQSRALWDTSRPVIEELVADDGLKLLFAVPWPAQGLFTIEPVNTAAEMQGVPFRAYNQATSRIAELMGSVPTQVEVAEIPQAFATGIVEAMITSPSTGVSASAWDFVNHFYTVNAWLPKNMVVVSQGAFDELSPAVRTAVLDAAAAAEIRGWEMSEAEAEEKKAILAENGVNVSPPSAQLAADFLTVGAAMTEEWLAEAGPSGEAILDAFSAQFTD